VHGKGSLQQKLAGDEWQKLANLRLLLAYQALRPGKQMIFMGTELAPPGEWDHDHSLPWHLADDPPRRGLQRCLEDLGRLYREHACLWRRDAEPGGFDWIDCSDRQQSVIAFLRWGDDHGPGPDHVVVVLNLTPVPREGYRIGLPRGGRYACCFNTDAGLYGGSDHATRSACQAERVAWHGREHSVELSLPPLSALVLRPEG
jgi:1,4-alpha-glucan branching enzyme